MTYEMRRILRRYLSRYLRACTAVMILGVGACVTTDVTHSGETAKAPRNMQTLDRVFAPMTGSEVHVLADVVQVDMSRELFVRGSYPNASTATFVVGRTDGSPSQRTYTPRNGVVTPVRFKVGSVTFHVVKSAVLRLYGHGGARFDLVATGGVAVLREGRPPIKTEKLEIRDGKWAW